MTFYEPLLSIHILAAITWIGGATTMQLLAIRARESATPAEMASVAGQAAWLGKRVLTPAAGIVLLAGILMVLISWSFEQLWIIFGLVAFAGSLLSGIFFLGPESERLAKLLDERDPADQEVQARIQRLFLFSRIELVVLMLIVADMVFKPGL